MHRHELRSEKRDVGDGFRVGARCEDFAAHFIKQENNWLIVSQSALAALGNTPQHASSLMGKLTVLEAAKSKIKVRLGWVQPRALFKARG